MRKLCLIVCFLAVGVFANPIPLAEHNRKEAQIQKIVSFVQTIISLVKDNSITDWSLSVLTADAQTPIASLKGRAPVIKHFDIDGWAANGQRISDGDYNIVLKLSGGDRELVSEKLNIRVSPHGIATMSADWQALTPAEVQAALTQQPQATKQAVPTQEVAVAEQAVPARIPSQTKKHSADSARKIDCNLHRTIHNDDTMRGSAFPSQNIMASPACIGYVPTRRYHIIRITEAYYRQLIRNPQTYFAASAFGQPKHPNYNVFFLTRARGRNYVTVVSRLLPHGSDPITSALALLENAIYATRNRQ